MKKLVLLLCFIAFTSSAFAQQAYNFKNETLELKTEVEGTLDLLWNTFDGKFRYFIKDQKEQLFELINTKGSDNKAYQNTLKLLSGQDASKTKLTLYSVSDFVNNYNATQDPNYKINDKKSKFKFRLGAFGGLTNNPFTTNPDNETVALIGTELEVVSDNTASRHAGFVNLRYSFESDEFQYSATQFALGYRFRFVNKPTFNIYAQTKFATLTFSNTTTAFVDTDNPGALITNQEHSTSFDVPLIFGIGADIKLGNGYLTLVYDSLFAVFIKNQDNFPVDFAVGYKFNL